MDSNAHPAVRHSVLVLLACTAVIAACSGPEERMARAIERGEQFLAEKDFEKARVEFSNALQIDPNNNEIIYLTGQAAEGLQDYRTAAAAYRAVLDADALHLPSMAALARMMVFAGEAEMAMAQIEPGFGVDPNHPGLLTVRAAAHAALGRTPESEADATAVVQAHPGHEEAAALLAGLYRVRGEHDRAADLIRRTIEHAPDSLDLRVVLARIHQSAGDIEQAEREYLALIERAPDDVVQRNRLASFYIESNRHADAEAILRENIAREPDELQHKVTLVSFLRARESFDAAEAQLQAFVTESPDDARLRLALGEFYAANGYDEDAEAVFEAVIETAGDEAPALQARNRLATRLLQDGRLDEAAAIVEQVIAVNPRDVDALTMRGGILLARNDLFAAITDFRSVLRDVPESTIAALGLARAHAQNREPDLALEAYRQAVAFNPGNEVLRVEAAEFIRGTGRTEEAEALLTDAPEGVREGIPTLQTLFQTQMARVDHEAATQTAQRIIATHPESPVGYYLFGQTREVAGDATGAMAEYERALAKAPRGAEPLNALVRVMRANGQTEQARARLVQVTDRYPDHAVSHNLLAELQIAEQDFDGALQNLELAITASPGWSPPYRTKALIQERLGDLPGALGTFAHGMQQTGATVQIGVPYAALLLREGEPEAAIEVYESLYAVVPGSELIANNLAMLLATYRDDEASFERAFDVVQMFRTSEVPAFLDTYGWVRLKQGSVDEALSYLRRAAEGMPDNPSVRYHYGRALLESGEPDAAREQLVAAIETEAGFPELALAQALLSGLEEQG